MNGAESVVRTLLANGVTVFFANPGTSEIHVMAALDRYPEMSCILCLFEGGATGAADGYYRMCQRPAATLLHLAPGLGNGFANLHNARKARSGVVNIVGEHATYHLAFESPLKGNLEALSSSISHWTRVSTDTATIGMDSAAAVRAALSNHGQISTLIVPADAAWGGGGKEAGSQPPPALHKPRPEQIKAAVELLRQPGAALLLDGPALWGKASVVAGQIAKATGCRLLTPFLVSRIRRGAGSVRMTRLAYRIPDNRELLRDVTTFVLCGGTRPVSFFAYPDQPTFPELPGCHYFELCHGDMDIVWTLEALAAEVGALSTKLDTSDLQPLDLPPLHMGPSTADGVCRILAALMPEDTILINEASSLTRVVETAAQSARGHDMLMVTGGSIGFGLPVAMGAAVACPARKVVAVVGDGSAMYTIQSLWTMARQHLDVIVVVLANRGYQTLKVELTNVGVTDAGRNASSMFDITGPALDFVALANGQGVSASKATTLEDFTMALKRAFSSSGPFLIEAEC